MSEDDRAKILRIYGEMKNGYAVLSKEIAESDREIRMRLERLERLAADGNAGDAEEDSRPCEACIRGHAEWVKAGCPGDGAEFAARAHGHSLSTFPDEPDYLSTIQ